VGCEKPTARCGGGPNVKSRAARRGKETRLFGQAAPPGCGFLRTLRGGGGVAGERKLGHKKVAFNTEKKKKTTRDT